MEKEKQKTFSFKVSDNIKEEMVEYFQDKKRDKTPEYALFQADEADTVVTLYGSGKVVFQGISADIDANMWRERELTVNGKLPEEKEKKEKDKKEDNTDYYFINSIGSDEVGTGDYFGPIIVTASYVSRKDISYLEELGVRDSKKISDDKIKNIAPSIIKRIPHVTIMLSNKEYNDNYSENNNMNKIKAILHNKVLYQLLHKDNYYYDMIVVDEFAKKYVYFSYLKEISNVVRNITFTTKAEDKCLSVACASIISRYIFLREMDNISKDLGIEIPKGASARVDVIGKEIVEKYGEEKLKYVSKFNFKNTDRIKNM